MDLNFVDPQSSDAASVTFINIGGFKL